MTITFDSYSEYLTHHESAHDAILYWKKVLQDCEGKIQLYVTPADRHYTKEYAQQRIEECALVLKSIEDSIHPDYDYDGNPILVNGVECYSAIIIKILGSLDARQGKPCYNMISQTNK